MEQVMERPKVKKKKRENTAVSNETKATPSPSNNIPVQQLNELKLEEETKRLDHCEDPVVENENTNTETVVETPEVLVTSFIPPVVEQNEFDRLLIKNKALMGELVRDQKLDLVAEPMESCPKVTIKPYTEAQLSSLYTNSELEMLDNFTTQFVEAELRGLAIKQHPLYDLLCNYSQVRSKITGNNLELEQLRTEYLDLQQNLWTTERVTCTGRGECQDGSMVTASHSYQKATFHRSIFQSIVRILGLIQKITYENHVLYSYTAEDLRLQIELYIQAAIYNCTSITHLDKNAPVILSMQEEPLHLKPHLSEIRLCISILFTFQRKLLKDSQFIQETRDWLSRLVAILLRLATYQDHLFILNHILRCPAGVGQWAAIYIQTPLQENLDDGSPFSSYQINHILAVFRMILLPIKERGRFLEEISQTRGECQWIVVDSDGEEDDECGNSLRENDLVALLAQLPLENLFRKVLLVRFKNFENCYKSSDVSQNHVLRFLAFGTVLLRIISTGLNTYNQTRYHQFAKRLSRLIRHLVQYATDQWELFSSTDTGDEAMRERLQVEYEAFFLRAIYYLYGSQKLGAWQFLAVVPYNLIRIETVWRIYNFLRDPETFALSLDCEGSRGDLIRAQFEERLSKLADDESYYLLNTFANMALARSDKDLDFIKTATKDLLEVGFVSNNTQEICSKNARTLLTHLTSKNPHLLSLILREIKENIQPIGNLALYLYEELPLTIWRLTDDDLGLISQLLLSPSNGTESKLARMILSRLNYDILPYDLHCDIALLVLRATEYEPSYIQWGWQTILRLKLHVNDLGFSDIRRVLDPENYDCIMRGINSQQPLAGFVAILMTTWGHLIPLIYSHGLPQLISLQNLHQKHEAVLFALYLIVPLFIDSQEYFINNEKFQEVISTLINTDRGYISMAKSFLVEQKTVLQQFGNMIETQIVNYASYNLQSPRCLVRFWINTLLSIPNWNRDFGIMYLLDVIIRAAFFHRDAVEAAAEILSDLIQNGASVEQNSGLGSIFKWVSNSGSASLIQGSLATFPWLAYLIIDLEFKDKEKRSGFWRELLWQLQGQKGKVSVDSAIKKAASSLKMQSFSSGYLCIYRWAQQAMDMPIDHPLSPLFWQKFFTLYLARIPPNTRNSASNNCDRICVGDKFFEGVINFSFLKRIKKKLQESVDHYQKQLTELDEDEVDSRQFTDNCLSVFKAFASWLEEPRLQSKSLLLQSLPPLYQPALLAYIMQDENTPWYQYVDYDRIKREQIESVKTWKASNFRHKNNVNQPLLNPGKSIESSDPIERIFRRLSVYETPQKPPQMKNSAPVIPVINFSSKEAMFATLDVSFKTLKQFSHNHILKVSEHKALDCSYQELAPQLYRSILNKVVKKVTCKGPSDTVHCSGAAVIVLEMQEARVHDRIDHQIQTNRNAFEALLSKSLENPAQTLCTASVTIQQVIKILQKELQCNPQTAELGTELFYYILSLINEETSAYLPTKTLFASCLDKLGRSHISGVEFEMPRLLEKILKEPAVGIYLAPHFSPTNVGTSNLLFMYSTINQEMANSNYDVAFALLSKFEIDKWLTVKEPKLKQRSDFIQCVVKALTVLGYEPPLEALTLHGLYRRHLLTVFEFQFPEHYGEILVNLLKASNGNDDSCLLSKNVWYDLLNSLWRPVKFDPKLPFKDPLKQYAQQQKMLQHQELLETAELLSKHFTQERLQYGLYGLYPKCRNYVDVFVILLGMVGHGIIISSINAHQGMLSDKMVQKIWPYLVNIFAPWIVPYSMQTLRDSMASWIQQLADDRSTLLPWIPSDGILAQKVISMFYNCIEFLIHTLPGCGNILSFVWQWYVSCFTHNSVKDHILGPIHSQLVNLPWSTFWPSVNDLECMLRVSEQYLPESHSFLGHVFVSVHWTAWLSNFRGSPPPTRCRVYQCFLNLLVKLSNEPNVRSRSSERIKSLLVEGESYDWDVVDDGIFQRVMDWYVQSCDPGVIFKSDPMDLDYRVLFFLKTVSGYNVPLTEHTNTTTSEIINKRLTYLRTYVKILSVYTHKHKSSVPAKENDFKSVITQQLCHTDRVVGTPEEYEQHLRELLSILDIRMINKCALKCFESWISNKAGNGITVKGLMAVVGTCVADNEAIAAVLECTLTSYFQNSTSTLERFTPSWTEVGDIVEITRTRQTDLELVMLNQGHFLSLYALFMQRINRGEDSEMVLNQAVDWMSDIKINESVESKLPLLWFGILQVSLRNCERDEPGTGAILYKFSKALLQLSEDKGGSRWGRGLLNAIGISKQGFVSISFRFLCRALAGYVLAQLPEMRGQPQVVRRTENAPARVGQPGGNTECAKVLLSLSLGQSQGRIKECEALALRQIQDAGNSMHNASKFLRGLVKQFYIKPYLREY